MTISLVVKGNRAVAVKAARNHLIPVTFVREIIGLYSHDTVLFCDDQYQMAVIKWYHETTGKAYPEGRPLGDLLLYSFGYTGFHNR